MIILQLVADKICDFVKFLDKLSAITNEGNKPHLFAIVTIMDLKDIKLEEVQKMAEELMIE